MPNREIEFDHHPEIAEGGKGIRRVELLGVKESLSGPTPRRLFFARMNDEAYTKTLGYINSVTRGVHVQYEFEDGQATMLDTPSITDKTVLIRDAFAAVREILNADLDESTALRRAGLTLSGAINYIHPYANGNGRTARVMHYLVEFGTERGDEEFNNELYAIIAKIPVYDTQGGRALDDSPLPEVTRALDQAAYIDDPDGYSADDGPARASRRVRVFLEVMSGHRQAPVREDVIRRERDPSTLGGSSTVRIEALSMDARTLLEHDYVARSAIPNYQPEDISPNSQRIVAMRRESSGDTIALDISELPE